MSKLIMGISIILLAGAGYFQNRAIDDLRTDVNRVSVIQVRCAGSADYGACVDRELERWADANR